MSTGRTIILLLLGAAAGAAVTAAVFLTTSPAPPARVAAVRDAPPPDSERADALPEAPAEAPAETLFSRDIDGDCVLRGRVETGGGAPLAGAAVRVWLHDQPWSLPQPETMGTSDEVGRFRLPGIDAALPLTLYADKPGYVAAPMASPPCGEAVTLVASEGAALAVRLQDGSGSPIDGAAVILSGENLWPPRVATSDPDGRLDIDGLPGGAFSVWAIRETLSAMTRAPLKVAVGERRTVSLTLEPFEPAKVRVLDADTRAPVSGTRVLATVTDAPLSEWGGQCDEDGAVSIPCGDARGCDVRVWAPGYVEAAPVRLFPGADIPILLERGGRITGTVVDRKGAPIPGARLEIASKQRGEADLGRNGGHRFAGALAGSIAAGWPRLWTWDGAGRPGPTALPVPAEDGASGAVSDALGRFELQGVPIAPVRLAATHPEMVMSGRDVAVDLSRSDAQSGVSIVMRRGSSAAVRVVDGRGVPIPGADVSVHDKGNSLLFSRSTDKEGYADCKGLPAYFKIAASHEGYVPAVTRVDGRVGDSLTLEMVLPPAEKQLRGRVTDQHGFGVDGVQVVAKSANRGHPQVLIGVTASDGTFLLEGAGEGSYRISADGGERGGAFAASADFQEETKLVLGSGGSSGDRDDALTVSPDTGAATDSDGAEMAASRDDALGTGQAPSHLADNLGTTGESATMRRAPAFSTQYDGADALPVTGPPPGRGGLPIQLDSRNGAVVVTAVSSGSRVETAGLVKGSRILSVDGEPVRGPADARRAIGGAIGTVVMLEVHEPETDDVYTIVVQRERVR